MADIVSKRGAGGKPDASPQVLSESDLQRQKAYEEIESGAEFKNLVRTKLKFIVPATLFFMVYYFALPVLVGFFGTNADGTKGFMDTRLFDGFSIAYLFALSQFIMAWILAFIYLLAFAPKMDKMIGKLADRVKAFRSQKGGK